MPHHNKIATCCYCGARSVLRLTARDGHELACGSCGAPLHEMKPIKLQPKRGQDRDVKPSRPAPAARAHWVPDEEYRRPKKKKRRKNFWREALEEAFEVIEEFF